MESNSSHVVVVSAPAFQDRYRISLCVLVSACEVRAQSLHSVPEMDNFASCCLREKEWKEKFVC